MAKDGYDIVVTPTAGGKAETVRATSHTTDQGGPSVGDEVCVVTTVDGKERRFPLAEYWVNVRS